MTGSSGNERAADAARATWLARRWESLAREDAEFYIWTDVAKGDDFGASGERDAARIWTMVEPQVAGRERVLELGCGIGRILLPMARRFDEAIGVDIAPTMLERLAHGAAAVGLPRVRGFLAADAWDRVGSVDLVYSHIVLQHIESWEIIASYFTRVAACLAPDGIFYAQFDTRRRTPLYHLKNALPDVVLPRNLKRGVRRIRRTPVAVRSLAAASGFRIVAETGMGTADTVVLLRREAVR